MPNPVFMIFSSQYDMNNIHNTTVCFNHETSCPKFNIMQAGTTCGASSQPDLIQNHFLIARMLRFLRHSRQKVPYLNISRQKVTYFNVFFDKNWNFLMFCNKQREIQRWNSFSLSFCLALHFLTLSPFPLISSYSLHFLLISSFSLHFLILFPFSHSLQISSFSVIS